MPPLIDHPSSWPARFILGLRWLLLILLAACHDAPRENPLDPQLPPAVELQVVLNDTAGTANLSWTSYVGSQPFAAYRVLRNVVRSTEVETLAVLSGISAVTWTDSSLAPNTAYEYRVAVANTHGFAEASATQQTEGYIVQPVQLLAAEVDLATGQVMMRWTRYTGGRFGAYRIERRQVGADAFTVLQRQTALDDTLYIDEQLQADLPYVYRVTVEAAGRDWPSNASDRQELTLTPLELATPSPDPQTGAIDLAWQQYRGPSFEAYAVHRRQVGSDADSVLEVLSGGRHHLGGHHGPPWVELPLHR